MFYYLTITHYLTTNNGTLKLFPLNIHHQQLKTHIKLVCTECLHVWSIMTSLTSANLGNEVEFISMDDYVINGWQKEPTA